MSVAELFELSEDAPHLRQALTHPSFANERRESADNQRLEFLGDAVLQFCASELVYERFGNADEGTLTRLRAQVVNAEALAEWARRHQVDQALFLGRGALASGLGASTNVLADAVEALIAASFLDAGLDAARRVCRQVVDFGLSHFAAEDGRDPKSALQEFVQAIGLPAPRYHVLESGGPAHARWFRVEVEVGEEALGSGNGRSKRLAERAAAEAALSQREHLLERFRPPSSPEAPGSAP
ncbi:MAG TPA: ribonuclease III [Polyangiaceae bacterium]|jgi:ribonuclease-3